MARIVRPTLLTTTDDGEALLLGAGGDACWTEAEFTSYAADIDQVVNFMASEPLVVAERSSKRLLTGIEQGSALVESDMDDDIDLIEILINLYAFLTSMRSFLDQSDRLVVKQFGKGSHELQQLRACINRMYDSNAAYRFIYALRNYAQHSSVPLDGITARAELVERSAPDGPTQSRLNVRCDRDVLLGDGEWKVVVREWLQSQPRHFAIGPIIADVMQCLLMVAMDFYCLRAESVLAAHRRLEPFWESFKVPPTGFTETVPGAPGYMVLDGISTGPPREFDFTEVPRTRYEDMVAAAERLTDDDEPDKILMTCYPITGLQLQLDHCAPPTST